MSAMSETTEAIVESRYLSAGANRYAAAADWSEDGLVAFGSDANVCLWNPADLGGISRILSGHTGHVRALKFIPRLDEETSAHLVSGGDDKELRLWAIDSETGAASCVQTVREHTGPVNCIAALGGAASGNAAGRIFVTGAADAAVRVWAFDAGQITLLQTIKTTKKYMPLAVALSPLDDEARGLVLAVAGTANSVQILTASAENGTAGLDFSLQATLPGHENWIRSLDFVRETEADGSDLLLASASQDKYIRLWRIHQGTALSALNATGIDLTVDALTPGNKIHKISAGETKYCIMFEALLLGHEDWIYTARWSRTRDGKLQLLSASADNSLSVWESDRESGIWLTMARLGEVSREKGATTATGSIGGFWTGLWSPSSTTIITLGRTGSWRRWDYDAGEDMWRQNLAVTGHVRAVTAISWSQDGVYLLSTSSDQTTRLHAEWIVGSSRSWHEMARPQIHGYDLNCIATLGATSFFSGADEKLMRVFTEPKGVARLLSRLTNTTTTPSQIAAAAPDAANMPVLGLSNKAKLYGHGYEIACLAASHAGGLVASACRASSLNHAVIRLFETRRWTELRPPLAAHALTVTRLRFAPDDRLLLSVGRDRQWVVWERAEAEAEAGREGGGGGPGYTLLQANAAGHARMVLDAAWAPPLLPPTVGGGGGGGAGTAVFATAGRDRRVKVWVRRGPRFELGVAVALEHPVTAVDFVPEVTPEGLLLLAVGTEAGRLLVLALKVDGGEVEVVSTRSVSPALCLPKAVLQLAWRPTTEGGEGRELAIAGEDGSLRIYKFGV
ncbi:WD40 repeat-like protein [Trichocladium antarcticum]|uniref:Elongator complex protein 2 n=1 Tax=Trichocladium antarcticum TaxID=1450529 RepID=A0AAN6UT56_9PEZI|nr:WD40 repeat-like protein [Trichocladium antarcticum]